MRHQPMFVSLGVTEKKSDLVSMLHLGSGGAWISDPVPRGTSVSVLSIFSFKEHSEEKVSFGG